MLLPTIVAEFCLVAFAARKFLRRGLVVDYVTSLAKKLLQVLRSLQPLLVYFYLGSHLVFTLGSIRQINDLF